MIQLQDSFRPYAAPANIIAVLRRARTRNFPEVINNEFLRITGIPEAVFGRVMQTLRFLNLVHEDGRPTENFEAIARATDSQYREILENIVRDAYRIEFSKVDPGKDPQSRILDAFRPRQPRSQKIRMVMLFLALCRESGIPVLDVPRQRQMKESVVRKTDTTSEKTSARISSKIQHDEVRRSGLAIEHQNKMLFSVTEDDIGILSEKEFNEVWLALGIVTRARARARKQAAEQEIKRNTEVESKAE